MYVEIVIVVTISDELVVVVVMEGMVEGMVLVVVKGMVVLMEGVVLVVEEW